MAPIFYKGMETFNDLSEREPVNGTVLLVEERRKTPRGAGSSSVASAAARIMHMYCEESANGFELCALNKEHASTLPRMPIKHFNVVGRVVYAGGPTP